MESPIIGNPKHKVLRVAYLFYCASEIGLATPLDRPAYKASLHQLVGDALVVVKLAKFDVFNALSLMDDGLFLEEQKFGPGNGMSHYHYPFNSRASPVSRGIDGDDHLDKKMLSGIDFVNLLSATSRPNQVYVLSYMISFPAQFLVT